MAHRSLFRTCIYAAVLLAASPLMAADSTAPDTAGKPQGHLEVGDPAPEIAASTLDGTATSIAGLRLTNPDKIIVLQFASITDPIFRSHNQAVEYLAQKWKASAIFVLVYQKEAHPSDGTDPLDLNKADGFDLAKPTSEAERVKLASQAVDRLSIKNQTVLVDAWADTSSLHYGSYPNMTFVIDAKGKLQAGYPFMDVDKVRLVITALTTGQDVPDALRGAASHPQNGPAPFDFSGAAMDMTGGRGPATIASILDRITLSPQQREVIMPAVADFLADLQNFREARATQNGGRGAGTPAAAVAAPPAQTQVAGAKGKAAKTDTPEDPQTALSELRAAAQRLQTTARENLNDKDATTLLAALANLAPAQPLFSNSH